MSEQDQDAIVGRLIREKSQAIRRKAALDAELKMVTSAMENMALNVHSQSPDAIAGTLDPIRKYFNPEAFLSLLKERKEAQAEVAEKIRILRELGVSE